ncbi:50S ribosomal protein L33 [Candidatus Dojkabacteria bacterium]|nr:50S ribosomal protein L33 [Candidatus Dojkabacteria bacterium]
MAKKGNRQLIKLRNKNTGTFYVSQKNRVNTTDKVGVKKFDKKTGKHELFEEEKIK